MKQFGDTTFDGDTPLRFKSSTAMDEWPRDLRVQQMPRIYDRVPDTAQPSLFNGQ
jgi:hypothetical protein